MTTPTNPYDAEVHKRLGGMNPFRRRAAAAEQDPLVGEMGRNRAVNQRLARAMEKTGNAPGRGGADLSFATGRPRDPMFYWRQNNLPWDISKEEELKKIRAYCRILYMTHPIIASCIDIYSKYPLLGMELTCKDEQITEFYTNLFFDEQNGLNYNEFLIDFGREYWMVGEAWPFGSFNEVLGVWEDDELLNPDDCEVERSPFMRDPRYLIHLPQTLRDLIQKQSPRWEYEKLMAAYPELQHYASEDSLMPVSNVLLKQFKFKGDTFHKRGIPILMRAFRAVMQEEMMNSAMDAIADRLYTPLILAKLGASATDLGTTVPWIPTQDDLADFEEALDGALAADFRVLVHHFAVDMAPVFGRENMPNMGDDFDRLEERILQTFGLSKTMLSGASGGETYAADALNRDLISQLLTTYQNIVKSHYRDRALVVAEAQEHFDFDVRGGKRYVKMEEVLEIDEETGEERIVEQPKLLIPDMHMKSMSISDEESERQFLEALVQGGVPVSIKTRLINVPIEFEDEIEQVKDENIQRAVKEQETRKGTFLALRAAGLPIPQDLKDDFEPKAAQALDAQQAAEQGQIPMLGVDPMNTPNLTPMPGNGEDDQNVDPNTGQPMAVDPTAGAQIIPMPGAQRPPESDEMRDSMPKPAALYRGASRMRKVASENFVMDEVTKMQDEGEAPADRRPTGRFGNPKHIGMRVHLTEAIREEERQRDEKDAEAG